MAGFYGVKSSRVSPRFLHGNSTSHTWPFSAIAELIDNAYDPDVNATELWIDKRVINGIECLTFIDNGNGMNADKLYKMLSFGYNEKVAVGEFKPIGYYGNGFKSGSMRLGKDAMVFTRCQGSMSCGFLSQSFLEKVSADAVIVPIVTWNLPSKTRTAVSSTDTNLSSILKYSIFRTEQQLLAEFSSLDRCKSGTKIIIYNLKMDKRGKFELDFDSDALDFRNPETHLVDMTSLNRPINTQQPEYRRSLREYCSILYLKPRMKIMLRGSKVKTKMISKSLSRTETDVYKPTWLKKPIKIVFGFTSSTEPESYGLMMYYKNRLIKAYEKVGAQKQANEQGVGVVGVVEADFLEPIHNKQDFSRTEKYSAFMQNVANKLNEYWNEKTYGKLQNPQEQSAPLPDWTWVQCDNCLKWRRLPMGYTDQLPDKWYCRFSPDAAFNRCDIEEEPEDDDEALQASYVKTFKKKQEKEKRQAKAEEERKILERERELRDQQRMVERQIIELSRKNQELEVSSTQERSKPTIADFELARSRLGEYRNKMKEQESTILELNKQKELLEKQKKQLIELADNVQLSSSQNKINASELLFLGSVNILVEKIAGTSSSTVTSSSSSATSSRKRKNNSPEEGGVKMFIKTEDGDTVEVTRMDEDDNIIDLTLDEEESDDISKTTENGEKEKTTNKSDKDKTDKAGDSKKDDSADNQTNESATNEAGDASENKESSKDKEKQESKTDNSKDEMKTSQSTAVENQLDIKPDKALLDKQMKDKTVPSTNRGSQTVPVVMKLASLEEAELLKLSAVEKNTMLLSKTRELEEARGNLTSLQENIYRLLKIIVPDYDYGEPENVEKVILEFIRVNEEESQEASTS